jgi:hypothetical protein
MKKKDKINNIIDEIILYGENDMKLSYINKIKELKNSYDITNIVGLIEHFLKPHYENKTIEQYFDEELAKYNQICPLFSFNLISINQEQKTYLCNKIYEICNLLFK